MAKPKKSANRHQKKQELIELALREPLPKSTEVLILGAGAAGTVSAIAAAEAGASVCVLESDSEPLKRLLATGNGRCNFSTVSLEAKRYNDPDFVDQAFGTNPLDTILNFFKASGLRYELEDDRLYPLSRQAASVRNVLLARAKRAGVKFFCARKIESTEKEDGLWKVQVSEPISAEAEEVVTKHIHAKACVLATGSVTSWLDAKSLGLTSTPFTPMLCPLACEPSVQVALDGRRVRAMVRLTKERFPIWQERGEVLFRSFGLSGIVIFDASRRASEGDIVSLDLLPDVLQAELQQIITQTLGLGREENYNSLKGVLDGVLDPEIAEVLLNLYEKNLELPAPLGETLHPQDSAQSYAIGLISLIKNLPFRVEGPTQLASAQVYRGGLAADQFDPDTMSAKDASLEGLFASGEVLDIDGDCGGFNLSWAWISGLKAGAHAATYAQDI